MVCIMKSGTLFWQFPIVAKSQFNEQIWKQAAFLLACSLLTEDFSRYLFGYRCVNLVEGRFDSNQFFRALRPCGPQSAMNINEPLR